MKKIKIAVVGRGNIGKSAVRAIIAADDLELCGIVGRSNLSPEPGVNASVVDDIKKLGKVDVALLCLPSRSIPAYAARCLEAGISTVDSFDIHQQITALRAELGKTAKSHNTVAITAAGWDPGTDSVIRALLLAMAPNGATYTNFGPGMSMGHSVAARAVAGVKDALSITVPAGMGVHKRMVYVEVEEGAEFEKVAQALKNDEYFSHDETTVVQVSNIDQLRDAGHGVHIERKGTAAGAPNQLLEFNMRIDNPALTAQVMVTCARAASRLASGCYTLIEIPPVALLPGDAESWIGKLV